MRNITIKTVALLLLFCSTSAYAQSFAESTPAAYNAGYAGQSAITMAPADDQDDVGKRQSQDEWQAGHDRLEMETAIQNQAIMAPQY